MLDSDTKRRIDTARDILVGKVPDPKSQVEQITIALIYKFMDDMDAQAEELGGKRKFFTGEFASYGWAKLMAQSTSGEERIALYADGMVKMSQNPGVPALFRNIFKNAFLPYRDPETLKLFLKTINEFEYDHSERLGDAFEYLLSVLGSQGDAGQFRTPRHIIDFIVSIVDPKKNETVLDPACGTAGFLISAYKHILRANSTPAAIAPPANGNGDAEAAIHTSRIPAARGDKLTPDERKKLADNFRGYDISPDMVRLSLVNMYLHGFKDPHVFEYDTLTSQDRWNEMADVILANPPFMSPKGGIKPHNRFSVQSKRSEVLFVDYMAEHLTPAGRAGVIVPEGIIFQSQTAHKALRKMLVEQYLVAVVSLPAGVFNPYSGVKTSILILDKSLAKMGGQSDTVGFFKVENDGFNLGAQRRPIDKNDLPQVLAEVNEYLRRLRAQESVAAEDFTPTRGLIVAKEKIAANGEFNLSGERYREGSATSAAYPMVPLGELLTLEFGTRITKKNDEGTLYPVYGGGGESFRTDTYSRENDVVISRFAMSEECVRVVGGKFYLLDSGFTFSISEAYASRASKAYVTRILLNVQDRIYNCARGHAQKNIDVDAFKALEIPLPPLEVQKEIVAEIEAYQKVIDGARAVLDHYRPHIPIQPDWPMVELGEVAEINPKKSEVGGLPRETVVSFVPMADLGEHSITFEPKDSKPLSEVGASYTYFRDNDVLIAKVTPCFENGKAGIARNLLNGIGFGSSEFFVIRCSEKLLPEWAFFSVANAAFRASATEKMTGTGGLQRVPRAVLEEHAIPLPPLPVQRSIVSEIEAERRLVEANRELIARMETKIAATLARVWGEGSSTTEGD